VSNVTRILDRVQQGEGKAAAELLPLVYEELRRLAAHQMAHQPPGQTLQPTALVHEAWLRLVRGEDQTWQNRAHFFAAAAEAMRRILIERARGRNRLKHGGGRQRMELTDVAAGEDPEALDMIALDEALIRLRGFDRRLEQVVNLRFFAGLTVDQTADVMEIAPRTVKRDWEFARAWLLTAMTEPSGPTS
jgi:RNA polymerase sigma factor (TIGR02999 family)